MGHDWWLGFKKKSVKIEIKSKFKNTSNHQNFMSMESKTDGT